MPMYDYRCDACGKVWEENLTIAKKDEPCERACPHCQKEHVERENGTDKQWFTRQIQDWH